jgi:hypothetical protein
MPWGSASCVMLAAVRVLSAEPSASIVRIETLMVHLSEGLICSGNDHIVVGVGNGGQWRSSKFHRRVI